MLWKIVNCSSNIGKFIVPNRVYTVGRLESDIIINDKSVSRNHSKLFYDSEKNSLCVEDLSKFGTFINKSPLPNKQGFLNDGDILTFGAQPGVNYQCSKINFDLIMSTLTQSDKLKLNECLKVVGGRLLNDWMESICYLVMTELKVTYKVICALIKQIPIVTALFIEEMHNYFLGNRNDEPIPDRYLPPTKDVNIVDKNISLMPDIKRRTLFSDKTFYFLTAKKLSHLELAIVSAGGKTVLLTDSNFNHTSAMRELSGVNNIVMYEATEDNLVTQVFIVLKKLGQRPIIDSEIGFAVLHVSTEEFCNPTKMCTDSIYSETNLSQFLSVNPFHMDIDCPRDISPVNDEKRSSYKRPYNEKENTEPSLENILKKRRMQSSSKQTLPDDNQQINTVEFDDIVQKSIVTEKSSKVSKKPKENVTKDDYLENYLKENNDFFSGNVETRKPMSKSIDRVTDHFDDDFDQIEIPCFGPEVIEVKKSSSRVSEPFKGEQGEKLWNKVEDISLKDEQSMSSEFASHPIKLVAANVQNKILTDNVSETKWNFETLSDSKLTKYESLVVEDLSDASRVNVNFKTFKKISSAYFQVDPIAMEIFNRKNYH